LFAEIPSNNRSANDLYKGSVAAMLAWIKKKLPVPLSSEAKGGSSFRIELPGQWVEAVEIPELGIWTLRLEQPDAPFKGRSAVAGRTWTTDLAIVRRETGLEFGCRVSCASLAYSDEPIALTRPRIVVDLANAVGLNDVRPLSGKPWLIESEADLFELRAFLLNPARTLPVTMLTEPDKKQVLVPVADYVIDPHDLALKTQGLAHIVMMPSAWGFRWTQLMGKRWTAYYGAVITYRPGMNVEEDPPYVHPKVLLDHILFWRHRELEGEKAFSEFLIDKAFSHSAAKPEHWKGLHFLLDARTKQTELARQKAGAEADWQKLYLDEISALKAQTVELEAEAEKFNDDAMQAGRERDDAVEENRRLRYFIDSLRESLRVKDGSDPDDAIPIPGTYEDLPTWVATHLMGRLVLHSRALQALKDAAYEDPQVVYRALLLLANEYRGARMGLGGSKDAFDEKANELHLRCSGSIDQTRAYQEGETYFVRFPYGSSRKRFLETHLRRGSTKDDRHCLAIYFFWDDETRQVVVGWLPSHLDNRMT
jgi:hypothetical protein